MPTISNKTVLQTVTLGSVNNYPTYTSPLTIASTGAISTPSSTFAVDGVGATVWQVTNLGQIKAHTTGVYLTTGTVTNLGTITGLNSVELAKSGLVINGSSTVNTAYLDGTVDIGFGALGSNAGTVINYGRIHAQAGGIVFDRGGLIENFNAIVPEGNAVTLSFQSATIINTGLMIGGAYGGDYNANGIAATVAVTVTNSSTGQISGEGNAIDISGAAGTIVNHGIIAGGNFGDAKIGIAFSGTYNDTVVNSGSIASHYGGTAISFAGGDDLLVLYPGYSFDGVVDGAAGTNGIELAGGVGTFSLAGLGTSFLNFSQLSLLDGASWTLTNSASLAGGITLGAGTTLDIKGSITSTGTALSGTGSGVITNEGRIAGVTGIALATGGTVVSSGTISGSGGTAVGFGGSGTNLVVLKPGSVLVGDIVGAAGGTNTLELAGTGSGIVAGIGTHITNFQASTVDADASWTLTGNNAVYNGTTLTVLGTAQNSGSLFIAPTGLASVSGTFINSGSIGGAPVSLSGAGYLGNTATGTISGTGKAIVGTGTVANAGSIGGGPSDVGVYLSGGLVSNTDSGARITGYGYGVVLAGAGTVANDGTILALKPSGAAYGVRLSAGGEIVNATSSAYIGGRGGIIAANVAATVVNYGEIIGATRGGVRLAAGGTVIDRGTISGVGGARPGVFFGGSGDNLLVLEHGYKITGGITGSTAAGATNRVILSGSAGSAVTADYNALALSNIGTVGLADGIGDYATLQITNTAVLPALIVGLDGPHEAIDLTTIGQDGQITNIDNTNHRITVTGSAGGATLQFDASANLASFATQSDGASGTEIVVACFCRGTRILTDTGEVPVEELAIGDRVVTLGGAVEAVRWIGRRAYDGRFIAGNLAVLPVRIVAGALADNVPTRDLLVSPEHAMYLDSALVPAKYLVNDVTITQVNGIDAVEYFHVELDGHDVIIADGAPAETYVDTDNRLLFTNGAEYAALYPEDERPRWQFCAPRLDWDDPALKVIRANLLERAAPQGAEVDPNPDLHLLVDGTQLRPEFVGGNRYRFALPAGSRSVVLASRSAVPAHMDARSHDTRRLGVALERITLSDGNLTLEAWHSHIALCNGFHQDEATHRWTNGLAALPDAWLRPLDGPAIIEVQLIPNDLSYCAAA